MRHSESAAPHRRATRLERRPTPELQPRRRSAVSYSWESRFLSPLTHLRRLLGHVESGHHRHVLVLHVVAVEDERTQVVPEFEEYVDALVVAEQDGVLPCHAVLLGERWRSAVPAQNPEELGVDVDRVPPSAAGVLKMPDFTFLQLRCRDRHLELTRELA